MTARVSKSYTGIMRCIWISFIVAGLTFIFFIIQGDGVFTVADDYNYQQLTFGATVWSAIRSGDIGQWVWNLDLGSSLITGFSFYNLGSPFLWISLLFPKGSYPYLAGYLYIAKYVVASLSAYIYLRHVVRSDSKESEYIVIVGALLYAFSGYQTTNLMFHFHDSVAFFPLLLWGIENIDNKRRRPAFIAAIFINCLVNYFFFVQEAAFMVVYYLIRYWGISRRDYIRGIFTCLICGLLGVGMASVLFIPNMLYILGNNRAEITFDLEHILYDFRTFLFLIKGILLPGDTMNAESIVRGSNYDSTSCYLPLVGLSMVIAFIIADISWIRNLICLLFAINFIPILRSGFMLFTESYQRWWYMFVLILALATVKVLREPDQYPIKLGIGAYLSIVIIYIIWIQYLDRMNSDEPFIYSQEHWMVYCAIAIIGPMILAALYRMRWGRSGVVLAFTMLFCILTTALTLYYYRVNSTTDTNAYIHDYEAATQLEIINDQYRYDITDNLFTAPGDAAGYAAFTSTIENSSRRFDTLMDLYSTSQNWRRLTIPGLPELLGAKYGVKRDSDHDNIIDTVTKEGFTLYVTEQEAFPIGFAINKYIYEEELIDLPQEDRAIALMHAAVIRSEDEEMVITRMQHIDMGAINYDVPVADLISYASQYAVKNFSRSSHGFTCTTSYKTDQMVYFTVPNDTGWTATIDGVQVSIIDSGGMMLLPVPAGSHQIIMTYSTPGLHVGIVVSLVSFIIFALICFIEYRKGVISR